MQTHSGIGAWLAKKRIPRIALIAGLLPLGLIGIFSAAIVVCVANLRGWREAAGDCLIAFGILLAMVFVVDVEPLQVLVGAGSTWMIAVALGGLTGTYASLTLSIQALLVLAVLGLIVFAVAVPDSQMFWGEFLTGFVEQMAEFGVQVADPDVLLSLAPVMSGMMAASAIISSLVALLLGSSWASGAGGPAFKKMFLQVRLGYVVGAAAALSGIASVFGFGPEAGNFLLVLSIGFVVQGFAVMHWQVARRGWPWPFLLLVYMPFLMGSSLAVTALFMLAAVGFVDNWYGLRRTSTEVR
jgi:hypothetical protein